MRSTFLQKPVIIPLIFAVALGGCVTHWYKTGATEGEFEIAKANCISEAYHEAPTQTVPVTVGTGYTTPIYTSCTGDSWSASCVSTGGNYVPPAVIPVDVNRGARNAAFDSCMYNRGWSKQRPPPTATVPVSSDPPSYRAGVECDQEFGDRKTSDRQAYLECYRTKTCEYGGFCRQRQ